MGERLINYELSVEELKEVKDRLEEEGITVEPPVDEVIKDEELKSLISDVKVDDPVKMYLKDIEEKWNIDLSALSNEGKAAKRFDFVIKTDKMIYGIETNFYGGGGSKLNETARSYKMLSQEADTIDGFTFVWFTDGIGWKSARGNLRETFDVMDTVYNIDDMENGVMKRIFI